jgi:hypothetical protein
MFHEEFEINHSDDNIKASLMIPDDAKSKTGIVLAHGGIINRQSLIRPTNSFSEYLCKNLQTHVIAPDLIREPTSTKYTDLDDFSRKINITTKYLIEEYDIDKVYGFGHCVGGYSLIKSLQKNDEIDAIAIYGTLLKELEIASKNRLVNNLLQSIIHIKPKLNVRNIMKYFYDKETVDYLFNVMSKKDNYCYDNYEYVFDIESIIELSKFSSECLNIVKTWGKPALFLYGFNDSICNKTMKCYPDDYKDGNIMVKHIPETSHVTPCMESPEQLAKLYPLIQFYKNQMKRVNVGDNPVSHAQLREPIMC